MSTGLIALLDDVAGLARVAAASLDDVIGQAAKAGSKAAGVVIDDGAVTPQYVVGFAAARELPIVARIAVGSLRNKLLILLPLALLLSVLAPWAITPLLMLGGLFLCYEGAEKIFEALFPHAAHAHEASAHGLRPAASDAVGTDMAQDVVSPQLLEDIKVRGAIKTDFILSAEIMAITLAAIPEGALWIRAAVLAVVGIGITLGVYGAVAVIVKADDLGVLLVRSGARAVGRPFAALATLLGRALVRGMPVFLRLLGIVGTAAMVWVGGGILLHGLEQYGAAAPAHAVHALAELSTASMPQHAAGDVVHWLVGALGAGLAGLLAGAVTIPAVSLMIAPLWLRIRGAVRAR